MGRYEKAPQGAFSLDIYNMLEPYWNFNVPYNLSHRHLFEYVGAASIAQHLSFISEHTISPLVDTPKINANKIYQCRKETNRLPVLTFDGNPYNNVNSYLDELNKYIDPTMYFVFNSDSRYLQSTHANVSSFPTWLCMALLQCQRPNSFNKLYRISYLSGVARYYRLKLFQSIKPYIKSTDVVVINKFCPEHFLNTVPTGVSINANDFLVDLPWQSQDNLIDTDQSASCANNQHSTSHLAYESCVNITGETYVGDDLVLISEKTWKAYIAGCLVVNYGSPSMSDSLRDMGLEVWPEYNTNSNVDIQIKNITELFQRDDITELYRQNLEIVRHNRALVTSYQFRQQLAGPAISKIKEMI